MSIISIGAILWDVFETERHLGGAPLNVAAHARRLGESVALISAVGNDELGREALARCVELGLDTTFIAQTDVAPTGTVDVFLTDGQPDFTINRPAAYDYPVLTDDDMESLRAMEPAWLYFGTLEQLSSDVRRVVRRVMAAFPDVPRFYDINLRKESYTPELIRDLLRDATVLKINDEEIAVVLQMMGLPGGPLRGSAEALAAAFGLECVCITRGAAGCSVWRGDEFIECPGVPITVADTVGAGDAFSAAMMHILARDPPALRKAAELANRLGALVASRSGAVPEWTREDLDLLSSGTLILTRS